MLRAMRFREPKMSKFDRQTNFGRTGLFETVETTSLSAICMRNRSSVLLEELSVHDCRKQDSVR